MERFGEYFGKLITANKMTAAELSRVSGVPENTVYGLRKGTINPANVTDSNFIALAHALGMTAEELYTGKPTRSPGIDGRYSRLDAGGRALVDVALEAAEARQAEKEAVVQGA